MLLSRLPDSAAGFAESYGPLEPFIGSVVYQPALYCHALSRAVKRNDRKAILQYAGYLAHYTTDLTVPLHLTANYKGQYSDNPRFRNREYGDLHARFDTAFVSEILPTLTVKLRGTGREPIRYESMSQITRAALEKARHAYRLAEGIIRADLLACRKKGPPATGKDTLPECAASSSPRLSQAWHPPPP